MFIFRHQFFNLFKWGLVKLKTFLKSKETVQKLAENINWLNNGQKWVHPTNYMANELINLDTDIRIHSMPCTHRYVECSLIVLFSVGNQAHIVYVWDQQQYFVRKTKYSLRGNINVIKVEFTTKMLLFMPYYTKECSV